MENSLTKICKKLNDSIENGDSYYSFHVSTDGDGFGYISIRFKNVDSDSSDIKILTSHDSILNDEKNVISLVMNQINEAIDQLDYARNDILNYYKFQRE